MKRSEMIDLIWEKIKNYGEIDNELPELILRSVEDAGMAPPFSGPKNWQIQAWEDEDQTKNKTVRG